MAKRRKVSNMLGLAVLSTISLEPMHPYQIASLLRERGKGRDMEIKWGSFYTVVQNLQKHGLIAVADNVRQGGRPERTVYRITDAGREELADWVRELLAAPERERPRFKAGLSTLGLLSPDQVMDLLRQRVSALEQMIAHDRAELVRYRQEIVEIFIIEAEYDLAIREAELAWVQALLARLADGDFGRLEAWRGFHETGRSRWSRRAADEGSRRRHRSSKHRRDRPLRSG